MNKWSFGQRISAGYAALALLALVISTAAIFALRTVVSDKDRLISVNAQVLLDAERLRTAAELQVSSLRAYVITPEERFLTHLRTARDDFAAVQSRLRGSVDTQEGRQLLQAVERSSAEYSEASDQLAGLVRTNAKHDAIVQLFDERAIPARDRFKEQLRTFVVLEERQLAEARQEASDAASRAMLTVAALAALAAMIAVATAYLLARALSRQIGAAVGHVQSSSAELQAAATQQASGAKQQAGAMTEISTTISELGVTSRQIAESAQRVAQIAGETAGAARTGESTVERGQESMVGIRRQSDLVVNHMLDLGRKSQEIGAVLDIVSELAEQTNILAINATIEASGAGESGKRFAAVAEEIRKLADRVGASTKGIRTQIEDVRSAVNTTVMAAEGGSKAVDAGSRQFGEVAAAFKQIAGLVGATTEAAREIELSTKQQATAAEQVRLAVTDVAQATQESEASSSQTLQTASQLAGLSLDLRRFVQPRAA